LTLKNQFFDLSLIIKKEKLFLGVMK